ncbi:IS6 family transposase [Cyanobacteria bacterium FACHB-DQ100]|uniref:IS6 family transposase n=1 Tax=Leptolyngbya sp. DQ-M1 TaxID=2933920 RepID=UPI00198B35CD|nr:IS6 family transposase [Cyanobacteria bacterium FACHB-DQ100]
MYSRHQFPGEIISYCKFGQQYANPLRRKRPFIADKWHLDEVVVTIKGKQYYLWRAVDAESTVLGVLLQRHRDTHAAARFFHKLLKKQGFVPRMMVTDKLKSYEAAKKRVMPSVEHRTHKGLNNRAENSHQPTRVRERRMRRFKSLGQAQRFLSAFEPIRGHFHPKQHELSAKRYREQLCQRFEEWREIACVRVTA